LRCSALLHNSIRSAESASACRFSLEFISALFLYLPRYRVFGKSKKKDKSTASAEANTPLATPLAAAPEESPKEQPKETKKEPASPAVSVSPKLPKKIAGKR